MIELIDFSKSYSRKGDYAVQGISFVATDGEVTGLLGVNGSGKSTIIKAITGIHFATSGSVFITDTHGNKIDVEKNQEQAKLNIGYVPEITSLPPDMTVEKFLRYVAELYNRDSSTLRRCSVHASLGMTDGLIGLENAENCHFDRSDSGVEKSLSDVVKKCSLEDVLSKKIKTLSKGYKQRVSFAQAIIHNPSVLILDEPITGLDPAQIIQMRELIKSEAKTKTVLMSTHILQEVHSLCDKIIVIDKGKIVAEGSEAELIAQTGEGDFEKAFLKLVQSH